MGKEIIVEMRVYFRLLLSILALSYTIKWIVGKSAKNRGTRKSSAVSKKRVALSEETDGFLELAQFLDRYGKDPDIQKFSVDQIKRSLEVLSSGQNALKSMDGATHQFRNTFQDSSSLSSRFERFIASKRKNLKEAAKLHEYTTTVERSLQAAELIQAVSTKDTTRRAEFLAAAGLREEKRFVITENKISLVVALLIPTASESGTEHIDWEQLPEQKKRELRSQPQRFFPGEVVVVVVEETQKDNVHVAQMLRLVVSEPPTLVPLNSRGVLQEEVLVQPTYLRLAERALEGLVDYLLPVAAMRVVLNATEEVKVEEERAARLDLSTNQKMDSVFIKSADLLGNKSKGSRKKGKKDNKPLRYQKNKTDSSADKICNQTVETEIISSNLSRSGNPLPQRVRLIGFSAGGAVAAYTALVLDGSLNFSDPRVRSKTGLGTGVEIRQGSDADEIQVKLRNSKMLQKILKEGKKKSPRGQQEKGSHGKKVSSKSVSQASAEVRVSNPITSPGSNPDRGAIEGDALAGMVGSFHNRVRCLTLGSPPCLSRSLVPKFISSVACGDDVVVRLQKEALDNLQDRVRRALKAGAGGQGMLSWAMAAPNMLSDLSAVTGQGMSRYKVSKKDTSTLNVPGRVFFIKPRKLKEGATIQRILRGNWQEDFLWQIHEILLSTRLMEHHSLQTYIKTLARC